MSWAYLVAGIVVAAIFVSLFIGLLCFRQIRDALFGTAANRRLREHQTPAGGPLAGHLFRDPEYFWAPAASLLPYEGGGAKHDRLNPALAEVVHGRIKALRQADPGNLNPVPYDLIAGSGGILDPYISLAAAEYQVARVARVRGFEQQRVRVLVADATDGRLFGFLGEPRVDVLKLNLALDAAR